MDDDSFLVNPASDALFQVNGTGSAIWRLLAEPMTIDAVASALAAAFPTVGIETIRADVETIISRLTGRGLLLRYDEASPDAA